LTTPLNRRLLPILRHYFQLSQRLDEQNKTTSTTRSSSTGALAAADGSSSGRTTSTRALFSIASGLSPSDLRRSVIERADSVDALQAVPQSDIELAEAEWPDLLLSKLIQLFLPPGFEEEEENCSAGGDDEDDDSSSSSFSSSAIHPTLLQSAVPPTAAPSSLTASDGAHKRLMRRKNRSESFRSDRIGDGGPEDDDHDEDDYYEDDDANSASSSNTKSTGDSNAASARVTKSAEQAAGREPPFFAILCRLLDTRRPALLVRFCRLLLPLRAPVSATSTTRQVPFYLQQVYEALPPFLHYAFEPYSQMTESEPRMQARVWLLCQINQAPNGAFTRSLACARVGSHSHSMSHSICSIATSPSIGPMG